MKKMKDLEWVEAQKIVITTDLVTATKRHLKFLKVVHENGKLYNGCVLGRAIFRYKHCWLPLLAKYSRSKIYEWRLVVPLDCEWIWHCHRLNPVRYMADCKELFGIILDPCGVVISSVEGSCSKKETEALWNAMYPEEPYELDFDACFDNVPGNLSSAIKYDLVSAIKRQSSFYYQVSRSFMKEDVFLEGAVERYRGFLHMIRRNMSTKSNNFCVPTYDIDLMWHTHQLHPLSYCSDMMRLLGNVLNHDDTDSDRTKGHKLDNGFSRTTKQWNEMFPSRYWRAGVMYMPPNRCVSYKTSHSEIMFVEIMVEVIEVRSLSTKHKPKLVLSIGKKQNDMLFKNKQHLSLCTKTEGEETQAQAVLFRCEPKGDLLFNLLDDGSSKSLGICSMSLSVFDSKLATPTCLEFESDMSVPITLGMVISRTQPSPMQHVVTRCERNDSGRLITGANGPVWTAGGVCSGSGGCGGGCGGGGGGGCTTSCGGCRSSCGGGSCDGK